jgi:hypothetical protein
MANGMTRRGRPRAGTSQMQRFCSYIRLSNDCWEWADTKVKNGYAQFILTKRQKVYAHRFSYERFVSAIPHGMQIDHICRNRGCINPGHMRVLTNRENVIIGIGPTALNAQKTHCKRGHELSGHNLRLLGGPSRGGYVSRDCRQCRRDREKERAT